MTGFWQDLRQAFRGMQKQPGFTLIAAITLALGIGANTTIFSVINALILNPPQFADAERVVALWRTPKDKRTKGPASYLDLQEWNAQNHSFEAIAGYKPNPFTVIDEQAERVQGMRVTANFLSLLKVHPVLGRDFQPDEEKRGANNVVIISNQFWQNRLGGNASAVGTQLTLDGKPFTIIGVLPRDFEFPLAKESTELLTTIAGEGNNLDERGAFVFIPLGRLKQGITLAQAQADLTNIAGNLEQQYPQYWRNTTAYLIPAGEEIVGAETQRGLWVLLGAVIFLLLIACTNVSNLLLVRANKRQRELALRVALGASTWRILRQWLTESLLLALLAAGIGILLAGWGLKVIKFYGAGQLPRLDEVQIDLPVLTFTVIVSVLTAVIFSLLPAVKAARPDINEVLKAGAKTATSSGSSQLWRDSLVVAEVALGLVLLIGAGLMMRSFASLTNVHPGFDPSNVLTARITLSGAAYNDDTPARSRYVSQTLERLKALPGVESAAFVAPMPFSGAEIGGDFRFEGHAAPEPGREPSANVRNVTPEYFQTIKIPLLQGRYFNDQDRRSAIGAAIVNETFTRRYFVNESPVGQRISELGVNQNEGDPKQYEIVGVVGDIHHNSLTRSATPELYLPHQQNSWAWGNFLVRTTNDPAALTRSFEDTIRSTDKSIPVTRVRPLTAAISDTISQPRFYALLFGLFGVTGLLLTVTGIYSVISYTVSHHTREIGIRMALGAQGRDVLKLIVGKGLILTSIGIGLGLLGALGITRVMQALLFGISATDWVTFTAVATLLAVVGLIAAAIPARRATKVDPLVALRYE
ncbi:MAG TPA: ABC transporter permease [Pyrinomonadaceae bacterium]|nr:ABC transporter permease [Pyrinomonadaceae bacterium]